MEPLKDPCNDRQCASIGRPPARPLSRSLLWDKNGKPNCTVLRDHLLKEGRLRQEDILDIIHKTADIFRKEPTLLKLKDPITVVGDIHGQYFDFCKLLEVGGEPNETQYIFLGDYVDRGSYSFEVCALLFSYKICFPKRIWMLRGNHECRQMTAFFNFRDECEHKLNVEVYDAFMEAFDALPLAATINGKFLAIHGGLSPDFKTLDQVHKIDRFREPPKDGIFCDLLWSDPAEDKEGQTAKQTEPYLRNEVRGCSWFFTYTAAVHFAQKNSLLSIIRAHEAQIEGYKMHRTNEATGFPTVITIFSAPNYCDVYNNRAAILKFNNNTLNILQFNVSPHPYYLPNFMNVFSWSMPFVFEKVTEMLYHVLQPADGEDQDAALPELPPVVNKTMRKSLSYEQNRAVCLAASLSGIADGATAEDDEVPQLSKVLSKEKGDRLRNKVRTVARVARMFKTLREENELVIRLKGVCPGHKLAPGLLLQGKTGLTDELTRFENSKGIDLANEKRPKS
eukprot:GEMP01013455.1.p1 GENE.GEMP01013455.1~~GEMP01013455.1.p1  ORF type:complete len:508 (+),score=71.87 GEMP01013455.1:148-1671(+)